MLNKRDVITRIPIVLAFGIFVSSLICNDSMFNGLTFLTENPNIQSVILFLVSAFCVLLTFDFKKFPGKSELLLGLSISFWFCCLLYAVHMMIQSFLLVLISTAYHFYKTRFFSIRKPLFLLFWLYFLSIAISIFWANDKTFGIQRIGVYSTFLIIPFVFCFVNFNKNQVYHIISVFFRFVFVFAILSVCCWILQCKHINIPVADWFVSRKTLINNQYSFNLIYAWTNHHHPTYNAIGLILAFSTGLLANRNRTFLNITKIESVVFCLFAIILIVITQSRSGVICVVALLWLKVLIEAINYNKKSVVAWISVSVIMLAVGYFTCQSKINSFLDDPVRWVSFEAEAEYLKINPYYGTGVGDIPEFLYTEESAKEYGFDNIQLIDTRQCQFISDWVQSGIICFILILSIMGYLLYYSIKEKENLMMFYTTAFFLFMCIEMILYYETGNFYFVGVTCLLISICDTTQKERLYSSHK